MDVERIKNTDNWVPWTPGDEQNTFTVDGLAKFARYVSVDSVLRLNRLTVVDTNQFLNRGVTGKRELVSEVYARFLQWKRPYNIEPWIPRPGRFAQRVRDPEWINRDSGTCLDFAAAYAATCIACHLRPLIVFLLPDDLEQVGHAFVVVDTTDDATALSDLADEPGTRVVDRINSMKVLTYAEDEHLPMVDPTVSTRERQGSYSDATRAAERHLESGRVVALIDPVALFDEGDVRPYLPPDPMSKPLVGTHLPLMPQYLDIRGADGQPTEHEKILQRLTDDDARGLFVIAGPQGVGKSRLACRALELRDDGSSWFLSGTSPNALIDSLAAAELSESGGDPNALSHADRKAFAMEALSRLRESRAPWAVVIDNVTSPRGLQNWLPTPDADRHQQVIITTTDDHAGEWEEATTGEVIPVPALTSSEIELLVPGIAPATAEVIGGRLLFVRVLRQLLRQGVEVAGDSTTHTGCDSEGDVESVLQGLRYDTGASWLWRVVRQRFDEEPDIREQLDRAALVLALMCPVTLSTSVMEETGTRTAVEILADHGICDLIAGTASIHRLFAGAILHQRGDSTVIRAAIEILRSPSVVTALQRHDESESLDRLVTLVLSQVDDDALDDVQSDVAEALYSLASIQELHGRTEDSAKSYHRAQQRFEADGSLAQLAQCLFGRAREVNQKRKGALGSDPSAAIEEAIRWIHRSYEINRGLLDGGFADADPAAPARCNAMEGLLLSKQAAMEKDLTLRRGLLLRAIELLEASRDERRRILETGPAGTEYARTTEIARSEFNLGGRFVNLARTDPPAEVMSTLARADEVYSSVARTRREVLGLRPGHPHLSACEFGLGLVNYFRSQLVTTATLEDRTKWLREAQKYVNRALESRQDLDGVLDKNDTMKSAELAAKVLLARIALPGQVNGRCNEKATADVNKIYDEFKDEWVLD